MRYPFFYKKKNKSKFIIYTLVIAILLVIVNIYADPVVYQKLNEGNCGDSNCPPNAFQRWIPIVNNGFLILFVLLTALLGYELRKFNQLNVNVTNAEAKGKNEEISKVKLLK